MLGYSGSMPTISIHALREESDTYQKLGFDDFTISIHALREESDGTQVLTRPRIMHFNPRSP